MSFKPGRRGQHGFTPAQQPLYRDLLKRAFKVLCELTGLNPDTDGAFANWKVAFMKRTTGKASSSECNHAEDYDTVILALAEIVGDDALIDRFSKAVETRMLYLIDQKRDELARLKGRVIDDAYLFEICAHIVGRQMPTSLAELPGETLQQIFRVLDANVRSLAKQRRRETAHAA